ncbi:uncharacterized protein [Apostichopus japonicus]|uniref:uncharacterized protein isoform X2 n=1 Tax=Stichopus japonicus TaxID=307972 RepID=UPI003AB67814
MVMVKTHILRHNTLSSTPIGVIPRRAGSEVTGTNWPRPAYTLLLSLIIVLLQLVTGLFRLKGDYFRKDDPYPWARFSEMDKVPGDREGGISTLVGAATFCLHVIKLNLVLLLFKNYACFYIHGIGTAVVVFQVTGNKWPRPAYTLLVTGIYRLKEHYNSWFENHPLLRAGFTKLDNITGDGEEDMSSMMVTETLRLDAKQLLEMLNSVTTVGKLMNYACFYIHGIGTAVVVFQVTGNKWPRPAYTLLVTGIYRLKEHYNSWFENHPLLRAGFTKLDNITGDGEEDMSSMMVTETLRLDAKQLLEMLNSVTTVGKLMNYACFYIHGIGTAVVVFQVTGNKWPRPAYTLLVTGIYRLKEHYNSWFENHPLLRAGFTKLDNITGDGEEDMSSMMVTETLRLDAKQLLEMLNSVTTVGKLMNYACFYIHGIGTAVVVFQVTGNKWPRPAYTLLVTGIYRLKEHYNSWFENHPLLRAGFTKLDNITGDGEEDMSSMMVTETLRLDAKQLLEMLNSVTTVGKLMNYACFYIHGIGTAVVVFQVTGNKWPRPAYTLLVTGIYRLKEHYNSWFENHPLLRAGFTKLDNITGDGEEDMSSMMVTETLRLDAKQLLEMLNSVTTVGKLMNYACFYIHGIGTAVVVFQVTSNKWPRPAYTLLVTGIYRLKEHYNSWFENHPLLRAGFTKLDNITGDGEEDMSSMNIVETLRLDAKQLLEMLNSVTTVGKLMNVLEKLTLTRLPDMFASILNENLQASLWFSGLTFVVSNGVVTCHNNLCYFCLDHPSHVYCTLSGKILIQQQCLNFYSW